MDNWAGAILETTFDSTAPPPPTWQPAAYTCALAAAAADRTSSVARRYCLHHPDKLPANRQPIVDLVAVIIIVIIFNRLGVKHHFSFLIYQSVSIFWEE